LKVLELIEAGNARDAERMLTELVARAPHYVPGLLERALLHARNGQAILALYWANEVVVRTAHTDLDREIEGPERLSARFYLEVARALVDRCGG
jgi:hypothetical protein